MKWWAILATAVQCSLVVGLAFAVLGMLSTFRAITASGRSDPQLMAEGIGQAMVPVVLAVGVSTWGILGSVVIVAASSYRARWFYWASVALAALHIVAFPFGTLFGLAFLVLLIVKRAEFRSHAQGASAVAAA